MLPDTCPECGSEFISHVPYENNPDTGKPGPRTIHGCGVCGHTWVTAVRS